MNKGANQISREEIRKEKCKRSREKNTQVERITVYCMKNENLREFKRKDLELIRLNLEVQLSFLF